MLTSFGYHDSGGGTIVPRLAAKELARRGWDVTVFHAAVEPRRGAAPTTCASGRRTACGCVGVHNRRHGLWDREQAAARARRPADHAAFAAALDRVAPDVVHFHNLHNLGAALIDQTAARGHPVAGSRPTTTG